MITYKTDGPIGIYVIYLCNHIPSATVTHDQGETYVTVPFDDNDMLLAYLDESGYEHSIYQTTAK